MMRVDFRLLTYLCVGFRLSVALINKCCPDGEVVQIDNNLDSRRQFTCIGSKKSEKRFLVKKKRESERYVMNNSSLVSDMIGYNVLIDETTHWPACGEGSLKSSELTDSPIKVSQSSCVDVMDYHYHVFFCDDSNDDGPWVVKLRKCCGKNSVYDILNRQCVERNDTSALTVEYHQFLHDESVTFESGIPECRPDEVLVEYHSNIHNITIIEAALVITTANSHGPDVLTQTSYCVESTHQPSALGTQTDWNNSSPHFELKASSKWIAKVCHNQAICKQMPCVRKCCREGQRMVLENETSYCEHHHSHLSVTFHDFDINSSPIEPNVVEPSGEREKFFGGGLSGVNS